MKIRLSESLIVNSDSITSVELDEQCIIIVFNNKHEIREFYNTKD